MNRKELDEFRKELRDNLKEVKKILIGNGKIGLCEKVRDNEQRLKSQTKWLWIITVLLLAVMASSGITIQQILHTVRAVGGM